MCIQSISLRDKPQALFDNGLLLNIADLNSARNKNEVAKYMFTLERNA